MTRPWRPGRPVPAGEHPEDHYGPPEPRCTCPVFGPWPDLDCPKHNPEEESDE